MKNIINKVDSAVKFSYNISKGSEKSRQKLISKYNKQIFNKLEKSFKGNHISVEDVQKAIDSVLPEKKNIKILQLSAREKCEQVGCSNFIYDKKNNIIGQTIELSIKNNKISLGRLNVLMHELTHVIDALLNPKTTSRISKMYKRCTYTEELTNIIGKKLYNHEDIENSSSFFKHGIFINCKKKQILQKRKKEILNFLKGNTVQNKIDYVQEMKNTLIAERNAYTEEKKYIRILTKKYKIHISKFCGIKDIKNYLFDEKIKMLKEIGRKIIAKERKEHAKNKINK